MLHCSITALVLLFLPPSTHFLCTPSVFTKISFALAPSASSALALFINPSSVTSTEMTIITWNNAFSDPLFTIELNYPSFNNVLAVANNINPANDNITVTIPPVHAQDSYTTPSLRQYHQHSTSSPPAPTSTLLPGPTPPRRLRPLWGRVEPGPARARV
ncbi:hypothetical protein B0H11DRAFT_1213009 [Mycena galericulata]|nr:hypothetical protein B0H11DRAFT_1213009 [Mycena galericulata]